MDYQELIYSVSNHVLTITFNKPDKLNAFGPQIEREFREALQRADADPDVRAIVITGAGRAFCVGADMGALTNASESGVPGKKVEPAGKTIEANYERRLTYMLRISKPMICAINGPVAGIGFSITLFCDFRFMLDSANMSTSFARRGLIAEHGTSWMLQQLIGPMNALDLLMTARKTRSALGAFLFTRGLWLIVVEWLVEDGDPVSPGQPLLRLHPIVESADATEVTR